MTIVASLFPLLAASERKFAETHGLSFLSEGGEHTVYLDATRRHVVKVAKEGVGITLDLRKAAHEGEPSECLMARPATPREYLRRISLANKMLEDEILILGVVPRDGGSVAIVQMQPYYGRNKPTEEMIDRHLRALGFRLVNPAVIVGNDAMRFNTYYNEETNVLLGDCKPDNFCVKSAMNTPVPIDAIITQPTGRMQEFIRANLLSG